MATLPGESRDVWESLRLAHPGRTLRPKTRRNLLLFLQRRMLPGRRLRRRLRHGQIRSRSVLRCRQRIRCTRPSHNPQQRHWPRPSLHRFGTRRPNRIHRLSRLGSQHDRPPDAHRPSRLDRFRPTLRRTYLHSTTLESPVRGLILLSARAPQSHRLPNQGGVIRDNSVDSCLE